MAADEYQKQLSGRTAEKDKRMPKRGLTGGPLPGANRHDLFRFNIAPSYLFLSHRIRGVDSVFESKTVTYMGNFQKINNGCHPFGFSKDLLKRVQCSKTGTTTNHFW
ncbi:hypothetical protein TNIN_66031 [Trichonephila inaurata madagascariensis]|uniref:Uncharacterized protein n=1 Tax=Trichonephila inaurata madagascariensis TaxID=2747483 RepID=A0A8X6XCS9_9ARAC|nr:hypothetical protein TNIN_66031 [Trichonephila inaurata madagascariensis]